MSDDDLDSCCVVWLVVPLIVTGLLILLAKIAP